MNLNQIDNFKLGELNRANIFAFEKLMQEYGQKVDLKVKHYFSKDIYARELFIPKGTILTGKIHKYPQLNIMTKGKLKLVGEEGLEIVEAPFIICSPAGTKRLAEALEDTVWITVHGTSETDVEKIEDYFIAQTEQDYIDFKTKQLELFDAR